MDQDTFLKEFQEVTQRMCETVNRKNRDYSGDGAQDAFKNFRVSEVLGIIPTDAGMLVRITDKIARLSNLLTQENNVKDEKMEDTLLDLAAYSIIMYIYVKHEQENKNQKAEDDETSCSPEV